RAGKRYKKYAWETKAEAKQAEAEFLTELKRNPPPAPTMLSNVVSWYLIDSAAPELERSKHRLNTLYWNMKKFVLPFFGESISIGSIKTERIEDFIKAHRHAGRKPKTIKNLF